MSKNKSACSLCKENVSAKDKALQCDYCLCWSHIGCSKIDDIEYTFLGTHKALKYQCTLCIKKIQNIFKSIDTLAEKQSALECKLDTNFKQAQEELEKASKASSNKYLTVEDFASRLERIYSDFKAEINKMRSELSVLESKSANSDEEVKKKVVEVVSAHLESKENVKKSFSEIVQEQLDSTMSNMNNEVAKIQVGLAEVKKSNDEMKDHETRARNMIIYKLKETGNKEESVKQDRKFCMDLCNEVLGITVNEDDFRSIFRIGKKTEDKDKVRPLLVQFKEKTLKNKVMESMYKLKNASDEFRKVSITHDLTEKERKEVRDLVEEAKAKQASESGEYSWKVRGSPGQLRLIKVKIQQTVLTI